MPDTAAYVSDLIGRPWERDGLHCWSLVRTVILDLFGVEVPEVMSAPSGRRTKAAAFNDRPERQEWVETTAPGPWAIALMHRRGAPVDLVEHAGVYLAINGGGILHVDDPHGVVFDSLFELPRVRTWGAPALFVPKENPSC